MKTKLIDKTGKPKKDIELGDTFSGKIRKDVLAKVFEAMKGADKSIRGSKVKAGAGYSASGILKHKRHDWKSTYGRGISRIPRKIFSRAGASFRWEGATVSNTRGGRRAHPPKAWEDLIKKINKKELKIAFNSGFIGTISEEAINKKYGEKIDSGFVVSSDVLEMKTKDFVSLLKKLFENNFDKVIKVKKQRAGRGKLRGRKYKSNAGLLFVIGSGEKTKRSGIDVVKVDELRIKDLAPNGEAGRITIYTEKAIAEINEIFGEKNE